MTKGQDRSTNASLPTLVENEPFQPLLDPLAEQEFNSVALSETQVPTVTQHEPEFDNVTGRVEPTAEKKTDYEEGKEETEGSACCATTSHTVGAAGIGVVGGSSWVLRLVAACGAARESRWNTGNNQMPPVPGHGS
jgi:hypothetical protein